MLKSNVPRTLLLGIGMSLETIVKSDVDKTGTGAISFGNAKAANTYN